MTETHVQHDGLDLEIDFFGQLPGFHIYTQMAFCFPMAPTKKHSEVLKALESGLLTLADAFPWVAGKVVSGNGVVKIKPHQRAPSLIVKDLTGDPSAPTMGGLRAARFPFRMLDENLIAPRNTIPGTSGEAPSDVFPVFIVQANFIYGGVILTVNAAHNVMDMVGQAQLIRMFSKACRSEPFTAADLKSGILDIKVPTMDDLSAARQKVQHQLRKRVQKANWEPDAGDEATTTQTRPPPPKKCVWAYFDFSRSSLDALKSLASATLPSSCKFISTDDALSAFIWQSIVRARIARGLPPTTPTATFGRAVDVRSALGISPAYIAIMQNMVYTRFPTLHSLVAAPLGAVAARLREALDPAAMADDTRALAACVRSAEDRPLVDVGASMDMEKDMMLSSWAKVRCYDFDFGMGLGTPECVRRPQFFPVESLLYLLPRTPEGGIALAACLNEDDMARLVEDEEFRRYGECIL